MKKTYKKISIATLSSVLVVGGVLSTGVNSFADSSTKASTSSQQQVKGDSRINFYLKGYGSVVSISKDENDFNKESFYDKTRCYNHGRSIKLRNLSEITNHLYQVKCSNNKNRKYDFMKVTYNDVYYLIALN